MSVEILNGATTVRFVKDEEAFNLWVKKRFTALYEDQDGRLSYTKMMKKL